MHKFPPLFRFYRLHIRSQTGSDSTLLLRLLSFFILEQFLFSFAYSCKRSASTNVIYNSYSNNSKSDVVLQDAFAKLRSNQTILVFFFNNELENYLFNDRKMRYLQQKWL